MTVPPVSGVTPPSPVTAPERTRAADPAAFTASLADGLRSVQGSLTTADELGRQLATGELTDVHDFMAAATKASLAVELTVAVRNRAVEAYQEIMRMQI